MLPANTKSVQTVMNELMAQPDVKSRFDAVLGKKTNKFISALVSLINADQNLTQALIENPSSVLQVALKAATYDLNIGNDLGHAYIIPFRVNGKPSAQFILGYKGIMQLAKRSGICTKIGATVVREGELEEVDYLYGDCKFNWIKDYDERRKKPIIGYVASMKENSGFEKMFFMSKEEMIEYEAKNRRGQYQSPSWKNNFDAMALKTVLRRLLGTYASISTSSESDNQSEVIREIVNSDADDYPPDVQDENVIDVETGEIKVGGSN